MRGIGDRLHEAFGMVAVGEFKGMQEFMDSHFERPLEDLVRVGFSGRHGSKPEKGDNRCASGHLRFSIDMGKDGQKEIMGSYADHPQRAFVLRGEVVEHYARMVLFSDVVEGIDRKNEQRGNHFGLNRKEPGCLKRQRAEVDGTQNTARHKRNDSRAFVQKSTSACQRAAQHRIIGSNMRRCLRGGGDFVFLQFFVQSRAMQAEHFRSF